MTQNLYLWLVPALPFAGFLLNGFLGRRLPKVLVSAIALVFPMAAFVVVARAAMVVFSSAGTPTLPYLENFGGSWITAGAFHVDFTFALDQLSLIMLLVITGVGFLIHLYSVGYMSDDPGYWRYFSYLNLFLFFMTILVLAENYLLMFIGWEGVGLASYLLIGFFYDKKSAADAGKKAFVVNRIGDFGFLIAMFLLLAQFGSLSFAQIGTSLAGSPTLHGGILTAICLFLILGATGKSAQIPLYIWLPDAMEGPTPVSALIHAATMVTAGVYLIARTHFLFDRSPFALVVIAVIGTATAFFAATVALVQTDIKRVLAYSTISQLGYMFLGCGVAAYSAAVFHLMTHAFFKALLFLAAGSVIHGLSGEQDMRKMGGLRKKLPITFWTMTAGVIAIAGIFPFAGFFSKDAILYEAFQHGTGGKVLYFVGLVTALLTSFYMFRLWYLTFMGQSRADAHPDPAHAEPVLIPTGPSQSHSSAHTVDGHAHQPHESPWIMLGPLAILALLSLVGGWIGIDRFSAFLAPVLGPISEPAHEAGGQTLDISLSVVAVAVALLGWFLADYFYRQKPDKPMALKAAFPGVCTLLENKYAVDELYGLAIIGPLLAFSRYVLGWIGEAVIVRGSAWLLGGGATLTGELSRRWQSGQIRSYAGWLAAGAAALLLFAALVASAHSGSFFYLGGISLHMLWAVGS